MCGETERAKLKVSCESDSGWDCRVRHDMTESVGWLHLDLSRGDMVLASHTHLYS